MTYMLNAIIVKKSDQHKLTDFYQRATAIDLDDNLSIIPCTHELLDEISQFTTSPLVGDFNYLNEKIETQLLQYFQNNPFTYIEADYFGGTGQQTTIIWENGKRVYLSQSSNREINKALKFLGVIKTNDQDEFDKVKLGRHRRTDDWLEDAD
ncbi:hypothetical protein MMO39_05815 [Acinetobacter modestus]|uniref:hypothetical protein n=1 Tax=Acinetobacter modestus TaxID=1776740 RepID=UPI001F4A8B1A|nr:hypothetical protein [Acinetobacter modestus]MCH7386817.1 hypothetical protein [Acinetobacter modestus]